MRTPPDKTIAFTFASHPTRASWANWSAVITFPPGATAETELSISVVNGDGVPEDGCVFEFAGKMLPVKNGLAHITYADFIEGKHSVPLWLRRPGKYPVPGGLTFG